MISRTALVASLGIAALIGFESPSSAQAADVSWINPAGGNWNTAGNWSTGTVPGPGDNAIITLDGTYTVALDASPSVASLTLGGASGTQTLSAVSRTLTLGGASVVNSNGRLTLNTSTLNGPGALGNDGTLTLNGGISNAPVDNRGVLRVPANHSLNGALSTSAGSTLRVEGTLGGSTVLTVANGFTNNGTIELTSTASVLTALSVTNGSLVNAAGAVIGILPGSGGVRTLTAQLENHGTLSLGTALTINKASADHANSGTIDLSAGSLTVSQSGTTPTFTNSAALTVPAGRAVSVSGGGFIHSGGALSGQGTLTLNSVTVALDADLSNGEVVVSATLGSVNGPGMLTNNGSLTLNAVTVNAPLDNRGIVRVTGTAAMNGALTTAPGSTLRLEATVGGSTALTVASGFTNNGTIELTSTASVLTTLSVTSGSLLNAAGGVISVLAGSGGTRTLTAQLDNQGTLSLGTALTIDKASADHVNNGLIDMSGGNLTLTQSGTTPTFTNSVLLTIPAGRTMSVSGGGIIHDGGSLAGEGTLTLSGVIATLNTDLSNGAVVLNATLGSVNGPGMLTNNGSLTLNAVTVNAPLDNQGVVRVTGTAAMNGALTTAPGSTLRVEATVGGSTALTVASGFTNNGTIELTSTASVLTTLSVTSGSLLNAAGGVISVLAGSGGARTLTAQIDNQGTLSLGTALTIDKASADHVNNGLIDMSGGNLTLTQSGTTPTFTNSGILAIPAGRTISVSGGGLIHDGGSLNGEGALTLSSVIATLNSALSNGAVVVSATLGSVNGPGMLTNNGSLTLNAVTVNAPLDNQGVVRVTGTAAMNGALTTAPGSTLRVEATVGGSTALTVASGFTNNGTIELTSSASVLTTLSVTSGSLLNAAGGVINVLAGSGGARTLTAQIDNQGTLSLGTALTINKASADHANSGAIAVSGGDLTLTQSGTTPTFTNTGTLTIAAGRTMTASGGGFLYGGGLGGEGTLTLSSMTLTLDAGLPTGTVALGLTLMTVNGPGTLTNDGSLTVNSCTINAPLDNQGTLRVTGTAAVNGVLTTAPGSTLRVEGTVGGSTALTVANGFTNNGMIELTSTAAVLATLSVTSGSLVNAANGAMNVLAGSGGTRTLTAQLDNQGTLSLGTALSINKASADHASSGTLDVSGGNLAITQSGTTPTFTNSGAFTIASGRTVTISGGSTLNAPGGTIRGAGMLVVSTSAFTNAGAIAPGVSPGTLAITGNASMAPASLLAFELGGYAPGTEHDRIAVSGTVFLAGALDVALIDGFFPSLGDSFVVLTAGSLGGGFSCLRGTEIGDGLALLPVIRATTLTLAVVASTSADSPPVAADDAALTAFDTPAVIPILANDADAEGDSIILRSLDTTGTLGSAVVNPDGVSITFTPLFLFLGEDTLRYTIGDCSGGSDVGLVIVTIGPATGVDLPEEPPPAAPDTARRVLAFAARPSANGTATITLALPQDADVEIDVFDLAGRRVERVVEGRLAAGNHDLAWGSSGNASGIYFARLVARAGREPMRRTTRVLLIR